MDIVYLITNKTKNKFYVGSKKNWGGPGSYWGSSRNKDFWNDFETDEFIFEVLFEVEREKDKPKKLLEEEIKELIKRNVLKDSSYYNKHIPTVGFSSLGDKRPGVGGVKKGQTPWNVGVSGYSIKSNGQEKGCLFQFVKRWKNDFDRLLELYSSHPSLKGEGVVQKNGKVLPYDRLFSKTYYKNFPTTTPEGLYRVLKNLDKHKETMNEFCEKQ
jgi:hypothetical protein